MQIGTKLPECYFKQISIIFRSKTVLIFSLKSEKVQNFTLAVSAFN